MALPPKLSDYAGDELRTYLLALERFLFADRVVISPGSGLKEESSPGGRPLSVTAIASVGVHFLANDGIPARTAGAYGGYTPGSAECDIMGAIGGGDVDFIGTRRIYNDSDIDVTEGAEGWAIPGYDGRLYAITEYCPDDGY